MSASLGSGTSSRRGHRPRWNQSLVFQIDAHIHPLDRSRAEQHHISCLGEDDVVGRREALRVDDRVADLPRDDATISGYNLSTRSVRTPSSWRNLFAN